MVWDLGVDQTEGPCKPKPTARVPATWLEQGGHGQQEGAPPVATSVLENAGQCSLLASGLPNRLFGTVLSPKPAALENLSSPTGDPLVAPHSAPTAAGKQPHPNKCSQSSGPPFATGARNLALLSPWSYFTILKALLKKIFFEQGHLGSSVS